MMIPHMLMYLFVVGIASLAIDCICEHFYKRIGNFLNNKIGARNRF